MEDRSASVEMAHQWPEFMSWWSRQTPKIVGAYENATKDLTMERRRYHEIGHGMEHGMANRNIMCGRQAA